MQNFANEFKDYLKLYQEVRKNKQIKRLEYICLLVHYIVGCEILTSLQKIEEMDKLKLCRYNENFDYISKIIETLLKKTIYDTSLCEKETDFILKMIDTPFNKDIIKQWFNDLDDLKDTKYGTFFKLVYDFSKDLEIIE